MGNYIFFSIYFVILYLILKNIRTYSVRYKICRAICQYRITNRIHYNHYIDYNCMESYNKTLFRLWDWGYKRIVNKYVYDEIKKYIKEYKHESD